MYCIPQRIAADQYQSLVNIQCLVNCLEINITILPYPDHKLKRLTLCAIYINNLRFLVLLQSSQAILYYWPLYYLEFLSSSLL